MVPRITCQTLLVPTGRAGGVEENLLIFSDDMLVAVVRSCEERVSDISQGFWILKIGYGLCASPPTNKDLTFRSPAEAQQWGLERVSRANTGAVPKVV
jgi:hypothetical protein